MTAASDQTRSGCVRASSASALSRRVSEHPRRSTLRRMDRRYDAYEVLGGLVGKTIHTLTGRPNTLVGIEGEWVRVGTSRSPSGTLVPIQWVQDVLDRLASHGEVEINVDSVGYRSAFIGAALSTLEDAECSPSTMRVKRRDQ